MRHEEDIHDLPTLPVAIPVPAAALRNPTLLEEEHRTFFDCADAWEDRTQPRLVPVGEHEDDSAVWWRSERRRWLGRWVATAVIVCVVLVAVALGNQL